MALPAVIVLCALVLVVASVLLWTGRRRGRARRAGALALGALAVVVALDAVPRQLVDRQVDACGVQDLDLRVAPTPVVWQLATGGLRGEVRIPDETVTEMVLDRLAEGTLSEPRVRLSDGAVRVDGVADSPMGRVPVGVHVDVSFEGGGLVMTPGEVEIAGRTLPGGMLDRRPAGAGSLADDVPRVCGDEGPGPRGRLTGVSVGEDGLVLEVAL